MVVFIRFQYYGIGLYVMWKYLKIEFIGYCYCQFDMKREMGLLVVNMWKIYVFVNLIVNQLMDLRFERIKVIF